MNEDEGFDVDKILNDLLRSVSPDRTASLKELFERRLSDLDISPTRAALLMGVDRRTLRGVLDGSQRRVGSEALLGLSSFLKLPVEQVTQLYLEAIANNPNEDLKPSISADKVQFIKDHFDLVAFKKAGFIDNITDFLEIEKRIVRFYGLKSLEDYKPPVQSVAFSAGALQPKNPHIRDQWIKAAETVFEVIGNSNSYDRAELVEYFPFIRRHCTNVEIGLVNVIRHLYKMGVTVIYQPALMSLHLRGATFAVNGKPCIVLTNYKGFYTTLWFALIHELFHVIFDWEDIMKNTYHLSGEDVDDLSVQERDEEADEFARKYLLSIEKTDEIRPFLRDDYQVRRFAEINDVHASFIYTFHAFDEGSTDRMAWARARRHDPSFGSLLTKLGNPWEHAKPLLERVKTIEGSLIR